MLHETSLSTHTELLAVDCTSYHSLRLATNHLHQSLQQTFNKLKFSFVMTQTS